MSNRIHYLAFGSNALSWRLQARTDSAISLGRVNLFGWRLAFHKRGEDGSGKADMVVGGNNDRIVGIVYEMKHHQLATLDHFEGSGYRRHAIEVDLDGSNLSCQFYRARSDFIETSLQPFHWYKRLVLAGLIEHGADAGYVEEVRRVASVPDPLATRSTRATADEALEAFARTHPSHAALLRTIGCDIKPVA